MDPKKLIFRVVPDLWGSAGVKGSIHLILRWATKGILAFAPEFIEELKNGLKATHKFAIAHELGHLENDDELQR